MWIGKKQKKLFRMKNKKWIILLLLLTICDFCDAQQEIITTYQNEQFPKLNIVLKGKVKNIIEFSYSPNKRCDSIPTFIDASSSKEMSSGRIIEIKCICDTVIYYFDDNFLPKQIKVIDYYIDVSNRKTQNEKVYLFENGNLISEFSSNNGEIDKETKYEYNINNSLMVKIDNLSSVVMIDSLEYDSSNNLIKKYTYRQGYRFKKRDLKKIKGQFVLKKNTKIIFETTLVDSEEYQYDIFNNLISKTWRNNRRKDVFIYDTLGNKIEEGYCVNFWGRKCRYSPSHGFVYDMNNRKIKTFSIGNWRPSNTDTYYQYDEHGQKTSVKGYYIYNKKDTVIGYHWIYEYDDYGQQIKEELIEGRPYYLSSLVNTNYKKLITTYDKYKNVTRQKYYTAENQIGQIIRYDYSYDSYGNWIKKEEYRGSNEEELVKTKIKERKLEYY